MSPQPKVQPQLKIAGSLIPEQISQEKSGVNPDLWPAGEDAALARLHNFIDTGLTHYKRDRDFPGLAGTSRLSPYLAQGVISVRRCFNEALSFNQGELDTGDAGAVAWLNELVWREFYKHILVAFPRVCKHKAFRENTDALPWSFDQKAFDKWCQGQTGFPIVDAAMRELNQTGWMHNRCRMITAMFLTKDLFIDWRHGERYFMQHLVDGDLASNNGGWQWSAGSGTDAAPYFRIYNPVTQSERFDPQGDYIRHYVPELAKLDNDAIHFPNAEQRKACDYPQAMVDHKAARERFLETYKQVVK